MPVVGVSISLVVISFIFGFLGRNKKMGFWGIFFATMFMTPLVGAILLIVCAKNEPVTDD